MRRFFKVLSILVVLTLIVGYLFIFTFNQVSAGAIPSSLSIQVGVRELEAAKPAYTRIIPNGNYSVQLTAVGGTNWLAVAGDYKEIPIGDEVLDGVGDSIGIDTTSGKVRIDQATQNVIVDTTADKLKWPYQGTFTLPKLAVTITGGIPDVIDGKTIYFPYVAKYRDYVSGTVSAGRDLYYLEDPPQTDDTLRPIHNVMVFAKVLGRGSTIIQTYGTEYVQDWGNQRSETLVSWKYDLNPSTGKAWAWKEVADLIAGVSLGKGENYVYDFYIQVETEIHSQTIHFVDPVEFTPSPANGWREIDLDTYVGGLGADVTGVIVHAVQKSAGNAEEVGLRKEGSTDALNGTFSYTSHSWMGTGVDANHIFEAYSGSTTNMDFFIVAYTTTGFTWLTNGVVYTPVGANWTEDIDLSADAPSATGVVLDATRVATQNFGARSAGSTDNRVQTVEYHYQAWVGVDGGQHVDIYEATAASTTVTLVGYMTDGVTWNTNAIDRSLGSTGSWQNISVTAGGGGVIIEAHSSTTVWGLRDDGSAEAILQGSRRKSWAVVESTADTIEGYISNTALDFWEQGIIEGAGGGDVYTISNAPTTFSFGIVTTNGTYSTAQGYFVVNDNSTASHKVQIATNNTVWVSGGGAVPWVHADNGTPGVNIAALWASNNTNAFNKLVTNSSPFTNLVDNWPPNTNFQWELRLLAPTGFTNGQPKFITVRLIVSAM